MVKVFFDRVRIAGLSSNPGNLAKSLCLDILRPKAGTRKTCLTLASSDATNAIQI